MSVPLPATPVTSKAAIASLACGICGCITGPITGIPAIISGHIGLRNVKRSQGQLGGRGAALAGVALGYVTSIVAMGLLVAAIRAIPDNVMQHYEQEKVGWKLHDIGAALARFETEHHQFPNDSTLGEVRTTSGVESGYPLSQLRSIADMDDLLSGPSDLQGEWYYFPGLKSGGHDVLVISPGVADKYQELLTDQTTRIVTLQQVHDDIATAKISPVNTPVRHKP